MICENKMCIFQKNNKCLKDRIELNRHGNCQDMIFPVIPEDFLDVYKNFSRNEFEQKSITK